MKRLLLLVLLLTAHARAQKVMIVYTEHGERDHVDFAHQAITFFQHQAAAEKFTLVVSNNWDVFNDATLKDVTAILWLNDEPHTPEQRATFERYMEHGGGWMGFHSAAYNDAGTHWPWFVQFLGGAVFKTNNWPPLPADLLVEDTTSPITRGLPGTFRAPANEWYGWYPNPRDNKGVHILLSLSPKNYPLGLKDTLIAGDIPVVWTNTRYRMLYVNMGHGDKIFSDKTQNRLLQQGLAWLLRGQ